MSFFNRIVSLRPSRTVVTLLHWNFNLLFESSCKVFQLQVYNIFTLHWAANLSFKKSREFANLGKNDHIEFYVNLTSYFFQNNIRDRLPYEKKFIYDRIDTHKIYKGLCLWRYKKTSSQWMHIYFIRKNNTYLLAGVPNITNSTHIHKWWSYAWFMKYCYIYIQLTCFQIIFIHEWCFSVGALCHFGFQINTKNKGPILCLIYLSIHDTNKHDLDETKVTCDFKNATKN